MKRHNIKTFAFKALILTVGIIFGATACEDDIYKQEKYKPVLYLLSSGTENVYTEGYPLSESESVRYFSIGCGGSLPNSEAVTVTLGPDDVLFDRYNKTTFDINVSSYARILPASRYDIDSYTITFPANPTDQYIKVPVRVRPQGLSPDTIYFIPLAIKSVSIYEVNPAKYNMLYRVTIENPYARQRTVTNYTKKGAMKNLDTGIETSLSGNKIVQPLTGTTVRMFAGNYVQGSTTTVADIKKYAINVNVNADSTVTITPYANLEVQQLPLDNYNVYKIEQQGLNTQRIFYLYYKFREKGSSTWYESKETLIRVEED